ncbi:DNA mismatch repair protein MSH4 [Capronia coronata CBS 617.96]|uniref:DNA mismatch repair protein MSH4 n=1 Tax=Capronia coronata CBS 617.96 TaxID=1182541 RepID=W9ZNF8_9EURO|nr:DNA mismatch repair protein MSH4 [Capronia coronata CBS 617.96]EXJ96014.1 DNA mismatch repair protein MSH4 [Capronia coronata CBS 617.96]
MPSRSISSVTGTSARSSTTPATSSVPDSSRWRPRTAKTSTDYSNSEIICAISESRGISPTVGLSFVNVYTSEAILCQFTDTQTYARTCHKLKVYEPTEILYMASAAESKLVSVVSENLDVDNGGPIGTKLDRRYWSESSGQDYVQRLAFPDDLESLKLALAGNHFATSCFSAVLQFVDMGLQKTFAPQTLRIKFETAEGSMMIDLSTIASLELVQNLQHIKSKECLLGLLNETFTPMGARFLRSNILQPSTDAEKIAKRHEALEELVSRQDMLFAARSALKSFVDTDRVLTVLVVIQTKIGIQYAEQAVNQVLMLKTFVDSIKPLWQALTGASSEELHEIRQARLLWSIHSTQTDLNQLCDPANYAEVDSIIRNSLNPDVRYSTKPTELRNQRVYAVQAGVNEFLDVARQTYKEINQDVFDMVEELKNAQELDLDLKFDAPRQFYIRIPAIQLEDKPIPDSFVNIYRRNTFIECQTLELIKMNQKIKDAHNEVISLSDHAVQELIEAVRSKIHPLFKISEAIAMLDMLASFAHLAITNDYVRPELLDTLAIKAGRHPIREKTQTDKYVPNDVYATEQKRFQIITGCNMSGKSTYIRSIALIAIMAQIGCFVPAAYASVPMTYQLFARVSTDDSIEANVSTFASEMREVAFILRNISPHSIVLIDELGRGTSTTDGLAIAIAIAEELIKAKALVWFVTHFRDVPRILAERAGVVNLHLAVDINADASKMKMSYKIAEGYEEEKFYGLALARVINLPERVIDTATRVSHALHERNEAGKRNTRTLATARRTKLLLNLREQLFQARESCRGTASEVGELRAWLARLQVEFSVRMTALDAEADLDQSETTSQVEEGAEAHDDDNDEIEEVRSTLDPDMDGT